MKTSNEMVAELTAAKAHVRGPKCRKIEIEELLDEAADRYDYGGDDYFYILDGYYIEYRSASGWHVENMSVDQQESTDQLAARVIEDNYTEDSSAPEALSLFGLDCLAVDRLDVVGNDYDGDCKVWKRSHYYDSHESNVQHSDWIRDHDHEAIIFSCAADAREAVKEAIKSRENNGLYMLSHGESSRPSYYIAAANQ